MVPAAAVTAVLVPTAAAAPTLSAATVRHAAAVVAAGKAAAAGVPPAVATLAQGVLRKMTLSRWLTQAALLTALALVLTSAVAVWNPTEAARTQFPAAAAVQTARSGRAGFGAGFEFPGKPSLRLPTDPKAIVVQLERSAASAPGCRMVLTIHANGRVVAEVPDGLFSLAPTELTRRAKGRILEEEPRPLKSKVLEGRLSHLEIMDLLRFAVHEEEFFDFDPAVVKAALGNKYHADGIVSDPTDDTTTKFHVQTADRKHQVTWSRLGKTVWENPRVERLLQLYALDQRLQHEFCVLLAGGRDRVAAITAKMNDLAEPYYRRYPGVARLTAADLVGVTPSADGWWMQYAFCRNQERTIRGPRFGVTIDVPQFGEPTLSCAILPETPVDP
jgi:hypothetical protein